ncbi:MAG: universal stress protein [Deltaproteobacteria bacterium]|nr:universal stress protein [Deltaproteobacteria bacterium]
MFKKILCAIDFDRNSMAALDFAGSLAKQNNAFLHGLHVVSVPMGGLGYPGEPYKRLGQVEQQNLQTLLNAHVPAEVRCESMVRVGKPAEQIVTAADELEVDLIVMATHDRGDVSRAIFGSVAESVLRTSHRPVLTVKLGSLSAALAPGTL